MTTVLIFAGGLLLGLGLGWFVASRTQKVAAQTTESVLELLRTEEAKSGEREKLMLERLRSSFGPRPASTAPYGPERLPSWGFGAAQAAAPSKVPMKIPM